jgi:hypothetical protein
MAPTMSIDLTRFSEDELLDLNRRIVERLRLMRSARQLVELTRFTVGMRVEFTTDDGRTLQGEITRLNRKTATVCCNPSDTGGSAQRCYGRSPARTARMRRARTSCRCSRITGTDKSD